MYLYSMCIWRIFGSNPVSVPTGMIALRGRSHLSLNDFAVLVDYDILGCLSYLQLMYVLRLILWRYTQPSIPALVRLATPNCVAISACIVPFTVLFLIPKPVTTTDSYYQSLTM